VVVIRVLVSPEIVERLLLTLRGQVRVFVPELLGEFDPLFLLHHLVIRLRMVRIVVGVAVYLALIVLWAPFLLGDPDIFLHFTTCTRGSASGTLTPALHHIIVRLYICM
jgi:hypothetical protein